MSNWVVADMYLRDVLLIVFYSKSGCTLEDQNNPDSSWPTITINILTELFQICSIRSKTVFSLPVRLVPRPKLLLLSCFVGQGRY